MTVTKKRGRKPKAKETPPEPPKETYDKEIADKLIQDSHERGLEQGRQEVWVAVANFIQGRMNAYFEAKQDDMAKESRDILIAIKQNIK